MLLSTWKLPPFSTSVVSKHSSSKIDTAQPVQPLPSGNVRVSRKACKRNFCAKRNRFCYPVDTDS